MRKNLFLFAVFFAIAATGCGSASNRPLPPRQGYEATGLAAGQGYEAAGTTGRRNYEATGLADVAPGATSDSDTGITLLNVRDPIKRGERGSLSIQGVPNTNYTITATYNNSRGIITATASKRSGEDGKVTWDWNVGRDTSPGTYRLIVSGGGKMITSSYTVT